MTEEAKSWRRRIVDRTPYYVTALGYVFGFGVLLGAASTFFIGSDLYSSATGVLRPTITEVALPNDSILLARVVLPGARISEGDAVAQVLDDPKEVADYRLNQRLEGALLEYKTIVSEEARSVQAKIEGMLDDLSRAETPKQIFTPAGGWIVESPSPMSTPGEYPQVVRARAPLFSVASLASATVDLTVNTKMAPSIRPGDRTGLLLAEWDKREIPALVRLVDPVATLETPRTEFDEETLRSIDEGNVASLELEENTIPCRASRLGEVVRFEIHGSDLPLQVLESIKPNDRQKVRLPQGNGQNIIGAWGAVHSRLVLEIRDRDLSESIRQALIEHLGEGTSEVSLTACWVRVGEQKVIRRLLGS